MKLNTLEFIEATHTTFKLGDHVCKVKGSEWSGYIVGFYSTELNAEGYCVESDTHRGSVQIYPAKALRLVNPKDETNKKITRNQALELYEIWGDSTSRFGFTEWLENGGYTKEEIDNIDYFVQNS